MKQCKTCGGFCETQAVVCEFCQKAFSGDEKELEDPLDFCVNCHKIIETEAQFCMNCGKSIVKTPLATEKSALTKAAYCPNCQWAFEDDSVFCVGCGSERSLISQELEAPQLTYLDGNEEGQVLSATTYQTEAVRIKEPMPKKKKLAFIVGVLVLLLMGGSYLCLANYYSKERQINRFVELLREKDARKLADVLQSSDPNYHITAAELTTFLDYYAVPGHKEEFSNLLADLEEAKDDLGDLSLKKVGKYFYLFDRYQYFLKPVYISLRANQKNVAFSLNGEKVGESDTDHFELDIGPLTPGEYIVEAESVKEKEKQTNIVNLMCYGNDDFEANQIISMVITKVSFNVVSNSKTGDVLIDGKKVGELTDGMLAVTDVIWHKGMTIQVVRKFADKSELTSMKQVIEEDTYPESSYDGKSVHSQLVLNLEGLKTTEDIQTMLNALYSDFGSYTNENFNFGASQLTELASFFEAEKNNVDYADFKGFILEIRQSKTKNRVEANASVENSQMVGKNVYEVIYLIEYKTVYVDYKEKSVTQVFRYKKATFIFDETTQKLKIRDLGGVENFEEVL